jgi:hypothetical protein
LFPVDQLQTILSRWSIARKLGEPDGTLMPSLVLIAPFISLGVCLLPVLLLRNRTYPRAQDYFVSSGHTPPGVIQNSSIAYALKIAIFGPFFAWGASGDFWPAIVGSAFLGLGLYLIYILRRPMLAFLGDAISRDRSITINAFIAQRHGNDPRVRLLASGLMVFALTGLIVCETIGVATILRPVLSGSAWLTYLFVCAVLAFMVLCAMPSGNSGVMYSAQVQLGALYLGLFGSTAFLLYLQISSLKSMPPHATLGIVFAAAACVLIPCYRHSRYVDSNIIIDPRLPGDGARVRLGASLLRSVQRILNVCISVFAVLVVVIALMEFYAEGPSAVVSGTATALLAGTRVPAIGLMALMLFALFYQIVDMTNWQRIAAFEKDRDASGGEPSPWSAAFRKFSIIYAVESPLGWLFMCAFGAIVVASMATPDGADVMQAFIQQLIAQQNSLAETALSLLLIGVFAMAVSTMSSLFSASLCAVRYDILPALWPEPASSEARGFEGAKATRRTVAVAVALGLVILAAVYLVGEWLQITFTSSRFLALVFAFSCAQLSFAPLVIGPLIRSRTSEGFGTVGFGTVGPNWALGILGSGAAAGVSAIAVYLATGHETWLWAAVPACLGTGVLVFAAARLRAGRAA